MMFDLYAVAPISTPSEEISQELSSIRNFRDLATACASIRPGRRLVRRK